MIRSVSDWMYRFETSQVLETCEVWLYTQLEFDLNKNGSADFGVEIA
jgi:hypothetical protein